MSLCLMELRALEPKSYSETKEIFDQLKVPVEDHEKDEVIKIGKGAEVNMDDEEFDANIASRENSKKGNGGDFDDDPIQLKKVENPYYDGDF